MQISREPSTTRSSLLNKSDFTLISDARRLCRHRRLWEAETACKNYATAVTLRRSASLIPRWILYYEGQRVCRYTTETVYRRRRARMKSTHIVVVAVVLVGCFISRFIREMWKRPSHSQQQLKVQFASLFNGKCNYRVEDIAVFAPLMRV